MVKTDVICIDELVQLYKDWLDFDDFYNIQTTLNCEKENIGSDTYLYGIDRQSCEPQRNIVSELGDTLVNVPVWFGDLNNSKERIMVLGLEPIHLAKEFTIERKGRNIFFAPFGIDRWNLKSSVKGRPQNRYLRVFQDLITRKDLFIVFSSIIKHVYLISILKSVNERMARTNFETLFKKQKQLLKNEIEIINPTKIILIGSPAFDFFEKEFDLNNIYKLKHPSFGNDEIARNLIQQIILEIYDENSLYQV